MKKLLFSVCTLLTVASALFVTPASALEVVRVNGSNCWARDSLTTICTLRVSNGFFTSTNTKALQVKVKSACATSSFNAFMDLRAYNSDKSVGRFLTFAAVEGFGGLMAIPTLANNATNRSMNTLEVMFGERKSCLEFLEAYRIT